MIFIQVAEILAGLKTETRRIHDNWHIPVGFSGLGDENDITEVCQWVGDGAYRPKWVVGRTYAVVPKRGQQTVWWKSRGDSVTIHNGYCDWHYPSNPDKKSIALPVTHAELEKRGFRPLRIRITALRLERLQDITEAGARAEGVIDRAEYQRLWTRIYKEDCPGSWKNNPLVWVITFELVRHDDAHA